ncbi:MAG: Rrf2 family transcriptional regulator [Anaerostipes sp.]|nr:Rrf2 family transcriptional regulator [Anaerostipes sp.]
MLITREVDYALRVLRILSEEKSMTVSEISEVEMIPQQFAYKTIRKLRKAGFVEVTRGAKGGCRLGIDLEEKSLYDLITVMEASRWINACMQEGYRCERSATCKGGCKIHPNLMNIQRQLDDQLKSCSLAMIIS